MAFDEDGPGRHGRAQGRRSPTRAYTLLTETVGFAPEDIILDPNIFAIGDRDRGARGYAVAYIEATRRIKDELPGALVCGGVSNVSFAFRGNDPVREAIHSVFLYHAIARRAWTWAIVNAGRARRSTTTSTPDLRERVEDVVLDRRPDATERLLDDRGRVRRAARRSSRRREDLAWRELPVDERLTHALVEGIDAWIVEDTEEARLAYEPADRGHRGPADGRHERRRRPVRRRARCSCRRSSRAPRVMKKAVAHLIPYIEAEARGRATARRTAGSCMATVKGDVHDIGKNIVGVVLGCNNYEVIDLGVMVPVRRRSSRPRARWTPTSSGCRA